MKHMKSIVLFFITILVSFQTITVFASVDSLSQESEKASERWTLERCIEYALAHNVNISDQDINVRRSENTLNQNRLNRYPTLNASASHNYNFGRSIDPFTNQFVTQRIQSNNFSITGNVVVFNGKRITNTIARSENELERARLQAKTTENQIALNVADAFLQVVFAQNQLKNFEEINKSTKTQLDQAKLMVDAGVTNERQYLNLKAQDARDKMNIQSAKGSIRMATLRLLQTMQYEGESIQIEKPDFQEFGVSNTISPEGVVMNAESIMPDVKLAQSQMKSAQLNEKISKSGLYPRLSLFVNVNSLYSESRLERFNQTSELREIGFVEGSNQPVVTQFTNYETRVASFGQQLQDNFGQAAGLSLSIPIFNNNQVRANMVDSKLSALIAENNIERVKVNLRADIIQAYTDYENAIASYASAIENEKAQKENYLFVEKSTNAGVSTTAEMVLALNDWSVAKNDVERARFQLVYSRTILNFYNTGEISISGN